MGEMSKWLSTMKMPDAPEGRGASGRPTLQQQTATGKGPGELSNKQMGEMSKWLSTMKMPDAPEGRGASGRPTLQQQTATGKRPEASIQQGSLADRLISVTEEVMRAPRHDRLIAFEMLARSPQGSMVKNAIMERFRGEFPTPPTMRNAQSESDWRFNQGSKIASRPVEGPALQHPKASKSAELSAKTVINDYLNNFLNDSRVRENLEALQREINSIISLRQASTEGIDEKMTSAIERLNAILVFPQLPYSENLISEEADTVVNAMTTKELKERGQETDKYLEEFFKQTGLNPSDYGRVVVNMSGEKNLCGYRAILSQIYSNCRDTRLACIEQGGLKGNEAFRAFYARISALYLTIAIGCTRQYLSDVVRGTKMYSRTTEIGNIGNCLKFYIDRLTGEAENPRGDSAGGMLGAEDVKYLSAALNRPIVIVESNKNGISMLEGNLKNTSIYIEAGKTLLDEISYIENENPEGSVSLEEMKTFLAGFPETIFNEKLKFVVKEKAQSILNHIHDNDGITAEDVKNIIIRELDALRRTKKRIDDDLRRFNEGGATVRIYDGNGESTDYNTYNTVLIDDAADADAASDDPCLLAKVKQEALGVALRNPKAVCLYGTGSHYMAVQRHGSEHD
jgi:hypothetical protein